MWTRAEHNPSAGRTDDLEDEGQGHPYSIGIWYEFGECGSNRFRVIVLTRFWRRTERRTDRQTDRRDR